DYEQESGTILAASSVYDSLWVPIDSVNNIWTQTWELNEPFPTYLCFEKNDTSGVEGIVPLKRVFDINFSFWESGSFYYDEMDSLIYYKPSGSDANDYVFYTNGYAPIVAQGQNNINILNIDLIGGYHAGISLEGSPKNVIIDGVSIKCRFGSGRVG
ncbi:MAG: hypothetical protein ACE5EY_11805, partial [Anaerolineae bacterium]